MKKNYIAPDMTVVEIRSKSSLLAGSVLGVDYNTTLDNGSSLGHESSFSDWGDDANYLDWEEEKLFVE